MRPCLLKDVLRTFSIWRVEVGFMMTRTRNRTVPVDYEYDYEHEHEHDSAR
jgi:hypothetical protein